MGTSAYAYLVYVVDTITAPTQITKYDPDTGAPIIHEIDRLLIPGTNIDLTQDDPDNHGLEGYAHDGRRYRVTPNKNRYSDTETGFAHVGGGFLHGSYKNTTGQPITHDAMAAKQREIDAIFDGLGVPTTGRRWLLIGELSY